MALPFWLKRACVRTGIARYLPVARRLTGGEPHYARYVSDRVLAAPLDELLDPATFPECPGREVIDLHSTPPESDWIAPLRTPRESVASNPLGLPELRATIRGSVDPPRDVLITHGATAAYAAVLDAFVNPGDRVALFDPCSPVFHLGAKSRRVNVRWISTWNEDGRTRFLNAGLTKAMRSAKLLVFAQPSDPTGGRFSAEDLEEIAWLANRNDTLLCIDESHGHYHDDSPPMDIGSLSGMDRRTFSIDSIGPLGWLRGPGVLVRAAALCASLNTPRPSASDQHAAVAALKRDRAGRELGWKELRERRQYAFDRLKGMGLEPKWPAGGTSIWVSVESSQLDGRAFAERCLREQKVLVGPGCAFGPSGNNFVRVSFAPEDGRLREGLSRLGRFVESLREPKPAAVPARIPTAVESEPSFSRV